MEMPSNGNEDKICTIEGCKNHRFCRGYCTIHYHRNYKHGDPLIFKGKIKKQCEIPNCNGEVVGYGFCRPHYYRFSVIKNAWIVIQNNQELSEK